MMKNRKEKTALRLAPCPSYDIECLESWLCDMAQNGYILKEHGTCLGIFRFTKGAPQQTTYRLEVAGNNTIWDDASNLPERNMLALCQEFGWAHITRYQDFDIYATVDAAPCELNTDPTLQARTLQAVKKRQATAMVVGVLYLCIWPLAILKKDFLQYALSINSVGMCAWFLLLLHWFFGELFALVHLSKLASTLRKTGDLNHKKPWKTAQRKHFLRIGATVGLLLVLITSFALAAP